LDTSGQFGEKKKRSEKKGGKPKRNWNGKIDREKNTRRKNGCKINKNGGTRKGASLARYSRGKNAKKASAAVLRKGA